jgi:hypothetical protein
MTAIKEWINPAWGTHRTVPPMEAGLRPNNRLDAAREMLPAGGPSPDAVVVIGRRLLFSSGSAVHEVRGAEVVTLAEVDGPVTALAVLGHSVLAAVEGVGLVVINTDGRVREHVSDPSVRSCVTDLAVNADGRVLASVGSSRHSADQWADSLLLDDRSGSIVLVADGRATVTATGLPWPAGLAWDGEDVLVSLSLTHSLERRSGSALGRPGATVVRNLPVHPGRIAAVEDGWWIAAPYARNRCTELILDEPDFCAEMMATIERRQWFVPRLGPTNPWTDPLQIGQIRVLGVVKPWAPPRSYGLIFKLHRSGRVVESAHSRVDGVRHGVTGVAVLGDSIVAAARGAENLYQMAPTEASR